MKVYITPEPDFAPFSEKFSKKKPIFALNLLCLGWYIKVYKCQVIYIIQQRPFGITDSNVYPRQDGFNNGL